MKRNRQLCDGRLAPVIGVSGLLIGASVAGEPAPVVMEQPAPEPSKSAFEEFADKLWSLPVLYENEEAPLIRRFALIGRYHGQYWRTEANTGEDGAWENRRWRFGAKVDLAGDLSFLTQFNLPRSNNFLSGGRFFRNIEDMVLEWEPGDTFSLSIGKQKARFSQEWWVSSTKILTFERSLGVNLLHPEKAWGINAAADYGALDWTLGAFLGGLDLDWLWPDFDAGVGLAASVGYEITDSNYVRFDYFYNDGDPQNIAFRPSEHNFSLNTENEWGRFGLITDLLFGTSNLRGQDLFGLVVMPTYDITENLELVTRYHYATSEGDDGVPLPARYAIPAVEDGSAITGDNFHALYAGLNYYLYGHKLKLMVGGEWSTLGGNADYDGWTFLTGVRMYF